MDDETLDVLIIGAGQAGLAMGYYLRPTSLHFRLVDRHAHLGERWRRRYESLVLFTPRSYCALPGLPVPGDPEGYPTKDEIAEYLTSYARHFDLPVMLGTGIHSVERVGDQFRVMTDSGALIESRTVILATGAFQRPAIPALAAQLAPEVCQLTPETYRNPQRVPGEQVLVVGDGATGRQIAAELAASREVFLATGRPRKVFPERFLGRHLFWWLDKLGVLRASRESVVGRYLMESDSFPGRDLALDRVRARGVNIRGRLVSAREREVEFADGSTATVDAVIWATGYREESDWVQIPEAKDAAGRLIHQRGISPVPNLYLIGQNWQWTRGSALLTGVGADAHYLTEHLVSRLPAVERTASQERGTLINAPSSSPYQPGKSQA